MPRNQDRFEFTALSEEIQERLKKARPRQETTQTERIYSGYVVDLLESAEKLALTWNKSLDDVRFEYGIESDYGHDSSYAQLEVAGLETDAQWHGRLMEEHRNQLQREEWERKEFDRLKAKFGK